MKQVAFIVAMAVLGQGSVTVAHGGYREPIATDASGTTSAEVAARVFRVSSCTVARSPAEGSSASQAPCRPG